jgi:poly(A) polymerase
MVVGGYVRDRIRGLNPHEIDMASNARPETIIDICKSNNIKAIPTGISHGTVTVILNNEKIEITTLRQDIKCYGRHAEVAFTDSWEEDGKRRDFTINALYLDRNLNLYDFFGGNKDLNENIVRFIGDPQERITEDYLRIMRYFRFLGYFETLQLDSKSISNAVKLADNLKKISPERIRSELLKLFSSQFVAIPLKIMLYNSIFHRIGLTINGNINCDKLYFSRDGVINLAIIMRLSFIRDIDPIKYLKFSNLEQKTISALLNQRLDNHFKNVLHKIVSNIDATTDIQRVVQDIGKDLYVKLFELHFCIEIKSLSSCDYCTALNNFKSIINSIALKDFPITGQDILDLGYSGKDIGIQLKAAKNLWINSNCTLEKQSLLKLIQS